MLSYSYAARMFTKMVDIDAVSEIYYVTEIRDKANMLIVRHALSLSLSFDFFENKFNYDFSFVWTNPYPACLSLSLWSMFRIQNEFIRN